MKKAINIPLDIPDITIKKIETDKDSNFIITVESTINGTHCHCCKKHITNPFGHSKEKKLRHTSILGKKTYIYISPLRYLCSYCAKKTTTTQELPWYDAKSSCTLAYENHILLQLVNSTVTDVAHKENVNKALIESIIARHTAPNGDSKQKLNIPLDIPDVSVMGIETDQDSNFIIAVESTKEGTYCQACKQFITNAYGHETIKKLRHTSILGKKTYIRISPLRYACPHCMTKTMTTQRLSWYEPKSPHTVAYENHVLRQLFNSTVADVATKENLTYEAIEEIIERHTKKGDKESLKKLGIRGRNEKHRKKDAQGFRLVPKEEEEKKVDA